MYSRQEPHRVIGQIWRYSTYHITKIILSCVDIIVCISELTLYFLISQLTLYFLILQLTFYFLISQLYLFYFMLAFSSSRLSSLSYSRISYHPLFFFPRISSFSFSPCLSLSHPFRGITVPYKLFQRLLYKLK